MFVQSFHVAAQRGSFIVVRGQSLYRVCWYSMWASVCILSYDLITSRLKEEGGTLLENDSSLSSVWYIRQDSLRCLWYFCPIDWDLTLDSISVGLSDFIETIYVAVVGLSKTEVVAFIGWRINDCRRTRLWHSHVIYSRLAEMSVRCASNFE